MMCCRSYYMEIAYIVIMQSIVFPSAPPVGYLALMSPSRSVNLVLATNRYLPPLYRRSAVRPRCPR